MQKYLVNKEISINIGATSFTLSKGDEILVENDCVKTLYYEDLLGRKNHLDLKRKPSHIFVQTSGAIQRKSISTCINNELSDITKQWHREELLGKLI